MMAVRVTEPEGRDCDSAQFQPFSVWLSLFHIPAPGQKIKPARPQFSFSGERDLPPREANHSTVGTCSHRRGLPSHPKAGKDPGRWVGARKEGASQGVCEPHTQACS